MNEMQSDLEKIEHLDFDIEEDQAKMCNGFTWRHPSGAVEGFQKRGHAPAEVRVSWACCGREAYFCIPCHNTICKVIWKSAVDHSSCGARLYHVKPFVDWSIL